MGNDNSHPLRLFSSARKKKKNSQEKSDNASQTPEQAFVMGREKCLQNENSFQQYQWSSPSPSPSRTFGNLSGAGWGLWETMSWKSARIAVDWFSKTSCTTDKMEDSCKCQRIKKHIFSDFLNTRHFWASFTMRYWSESHDGRWSEGPGHHWPPF